MRSHSYINTALRIIGSYDGSIPLSPFLKEFFKADKKYGSRDRREISHACYCFYRLGHAFTASEKSERMLIAVFLCSQEANLLLQELKPEWNQRVHLLVEEKLKHLHMDEPSQEIFPFTAFLSSAIDPVLFSRSMLIQPDLFLRIRPKHKKKVLEKLQDAAVAFEMAGEDCIRLPNATKTELLPEPDKEVVIQDLNSQRVIEPLLAVLETNEKFSVWDCCAASGGKSLLLHDHYPKAELTVSDIRPSIMANLQRRFKKAGIQHYHAFVGDVSKGQVPLKKKYGLIICDAPCSGSGTWSRTPEQLELFTEDKIDQYAALQKNILHHASTFLAPGGHLLYITCSVFEKENEAVVQWFLDHHTAELLDKKYFKGYENKSDTLFAALFTL